MPSRKPRASRSRRRRPMWLVFAAVVLLLGFGLALLRPTSTTQWVRPQYGLGASWPSTLIDFLVVLGLAAVAATGLKLAGRLVNRLRARRLEGQPAVGTLRIRALSPPGLASFALEGEESWMGALPSFAPYSGQRELVLPPLRGAPLQPLPPSVALRVTPELAHLPWEAAVLPATRPPLRNEQRACWRELGPLPAAERKPAARSPWWRRDHGPCWVVAPRRWRPLLEQNLSEAFATVDGTLADWSFDPDSLVVMGTPVETSAGTRLELQEDRADLAAGRARQRHLPRPLAGGRPGRAQRGSHPGGRRA